MKRRGLITSFVAISALLVSVTAQAVVIDLFSTDQAKLSNDINGSVVGSQVFSNAGDIIGNYRSLQAYTISGAISAQTGTSIGVGGGDLIFSTDSSVDGQGAVIWDGSTAAINTVAGFGVVQDPTGLGGIDLTAGGTLHSIALTTIFSDQSWAFTLYMYADATHWTSVQLLTTAVSTATTDYIPLAAFANPALCGTTGAAPGVGAIACGTGGTADPSNVGALMGILNTGSPLTTSIDLQLTDARTVPEPGTLALVGVALLGIGFSTKTGRRRRA